MAGIILQFGKKHASFCYEKLSDNLTQIALVKMLLLMNINKLFN